MQWITSNTVGFVFVQLVIKHVIADMSLYFLKFFILPFRQVLISRIQMAIGKASDPIMYEGYFFFIFDLTFLNSWVIVLQM